MLLSSHFDYSAISSSALGIYRNKKSFGFVSSGAGGDDTDGSPNVLVQLGDGQRRLGIFDCRVLLVGVCLLVATLLWMWVLL